MSARLAYCRASTGGQAEASQVEQHEAASYERLFVDRGMHGGVAPRDRPAMAELLAYAPGPDDDEALPRGLSWRCRGRAGR